MTTGRARAFPIGAGITLAELVDDPYPAYARLREREPVSWVAALDMWFVTRWADARDVLSDPETFTTAAPDATLARILGRQMLSLDGAEHHLYKTAFRPRFTPAAIRQDFYAIVDDIAGSLVDALPSGEPVDLRPALAARLPLLVMLRGFGVPAFAEVELRAIYDVLEAAIADHGRDAVLLAAARDAADDARALFRAHVPLAEAAELDADRTCDNLLLIFFGGISTVEALLLNTLHVLLRDHVRLTALRADPTRLRPLIEETMRWSGPVQSATRHAVSDCTIAGVTIAAGDIVNVMLGSANRDATAFAEADRFDPDRRDLARHLGFALGDHHCLGLHLARWEVERTIQCLLARFPALEFGPAGIPRIVGSEFRQPRDFQVIMR